MFVLENLDDKILRKLVQIKIARNPIYANDWVFIGKDIVTFYSDKLDAFLHDLCGKLQKRELWPTDFGFLRSFSQVVLCDVTELKENQKSFEGQVELENKIIEYKKKQENVERQFDMSTCQHLKLSFKNTIVSLKAMADLFKKMGFFSEFDLLEDVNIKQMNQYIDDGLKEIENKEDELSTVYRGIFDDALLIVKEKEIMNKRIKI